MKRIGYIGLFFIFYDRYYYLWMGDIIFYFISSLNGIVHFSIFKSPLDDKIIWEYFSFLYSNKYWYRQQFCKDYLSIPITLNKLKNRVMLKLNILMLKLNIQVDLLMHIHFTHIHFFLLVKFKYIRENYFIYRYGENELKYY